MLKCKGINDFLTLTKFENLIITLIGLSYVCYFIITYYDQSLIYNNTKLIHLLFDNEYLTYIHQTCRKACWKIGDVYFHNFIGYIFSWFFIGCIFSWFFIGYIFSWFFIGYIFS